ncbi:SERTA domain-containing protein 3, partial [Marasmius crinis-equi]
MDQPLKPSSPSPQKSSICCDSPSTVPSRPTFSGPHADFLLSKSEEYVCAVQNSTVKDCVVTVQRQFFAHWPVDLGSDDEQTPEFLEAVDDNAPLPEYLVPDATKLGPKDYEEQMGVYKQHIATLTKRKGQIERRLKRNHAKTHDVNPTHSTLKKKLEDPYTSLFLSLDDNKGKPKSTLAMYIWAKDNDEAVSTRVDGVRAKDGGSNHDVLRIWKAVVKEDFPKLIQEKQQEFEKHAKVEHEQAVNNWEDKMLGPPPTDPASRQKAIDGMVRFVKPILDGVATQMGLAVSLVAGGPLPVNGGRLTVMSVHSGTTLGDVPQNWGSAEYKTWQTQIYPSCSQFLKKSYTVEECRARALPEDYVHDLKPGLEDGVFSFVDPGDGAIAQELAGSSSQKTVEPAEKSAASSSTSRSVTTQLAPNKAMMRVSPSNTTANLTPTQLSDSPPPGPTRGRRITRHASLEPHPSPTKHGVTSRRALSSPLPPEPAQQTQHSPTPPVNTCRVLSSPPPPAQCMQQSETPLLTLLLSMEISQPCTPNPSPPASPQSSVHPLALPGPIVLLPPTPIPSQTGTPPSSSATVVVGNASSQAGKRKRAKSDNGRVESKRLTTTAPTPEEETGSLSDKCSYEDLPDYMQNTLQVFGNASDLPGHTKVIEHWLASEAEHGYKENGRLSAKNRP